MELLLTSFLAGVLTVLSPCVLPILPVVLAGSSGDKDRRTPLVIIASLAVSVFVFTLLLKGSTVLIGVPDSFWLVISGGLVAFIGLTFLLPGLWDLLVMKVGYTRVTSGLNQKSGQTKGTTRSVLLGLSLGPIFTSCSPTYGLILAAVLPASFWRGTLYIAMYTAGLSLVLLAVALGGRRLTSKLGWATKPGGSFRRVLGIILIVIGLLIATGYIKDIESWLVARGYIGTSEIEQYLPK